MSKKYLQRAAREGRMAVLPEFLQEGGEVWFWGQCNCGSDCGCPDMRSDLCPINNGFQRNDNAVMECTRRHPQLYHEDIWSVAAFFTPRGIEWVINDFDPVSERDLRKAFFPYREAALKERPRRIMHG